MGSAWRVECSDASWQLIRYCVCKEYRIGAAKLETLHCLNKTVLVNLKCFARRRPLK